jgi:hypothetical protein
MCLNPWRMRTDNATFAGPLIKHIYILCPGWVHCRSAMVRRCKLSILGFVFGVHARRWLVSRKGLRSDARAKWGTT